MVKGVSIKFKSYSETVPKLLSLLKLDIELKKHKSIVLKPALFLDESISTPALFTEMVLKFCLQHKNADSSIYIAEGAEEEDTSELYEKYGYNRIAEQCNVSLIDLNTAETELIRDGNFTKFEEIHYPKILLESFVIILPKLMEEKETGALTSLSSMLGAFPASHYQGFFSSKKNKMRKWPLKYAINDILSCKVPEFSLMDASDKGYILAGKPLEIDKQAMKLLGKDWKEIPYLRFVDENIANSLQDLAEKKEKAEAQKVEQKI